MKLKLTLAMALVVFFTAGCSGMQEKKPVSEQPQGNQPEKNGGQQEKPADETEKPNAQPGSTTDKSVKPSNQPKTTNLPIKIHDESIVKDSPIINITYPQIEGIKDKNTQAQINDILKKKANAADESQMTNEDPSTPSSFDSTYKITFQNDHLISFVYDQYFYLSGAAHGMPARVPILVDLDNGRIVEAKELFNGSPQTQQILSNLVVKQDVFHTLDAMGEFEQISSDDLEQVYLTKDGLMLYFPPYEYASFAEGTLQYHLSFSDIQNVLNTAFFQSHGIMISKSIASTMIYVSEGYHFSIPKEWLDRVTFERADYSDNQKWLSEINVYYKSADKPLLFSFHMYEKQEWTSLNTGAEVKLAEENDIVYSYSVAQIPQNNLQINNFIKNVFPEIVKTFQVEF
ncbi:DUF3298 and DUF4163 domain-containing protein [Bacillus sp. ISL-18]|uniref:DUF3298 and DUF4163 domain-containing protein n=1 Tax=Bacillus sp. ISL-18 TaxID=2819118 RepID=UPI001BEBD273|nr:DUF3298 and DUF4163 domain-containing protein [Bacillus sp. ISL-18]MBT2655238.1 DUF3298 and DUF4163 domain-containing protein [Bacillus sp. ISL-18]